MEMEGFEHIHQLDGGILKYFEEVGGSHYEGECFVFDQRVGLDPSLHETGSTQCFACLSPLTAAEQQDQRYQINVSCPYCYKTTEQQRAQSIQQRQEALSRVAHPLPGSQPYDNDRPLTVPLECERWTLLDFLCRVLPQIPREQWESECERGLLIGQKGQALAVHTEVRAGDRILHRHPGITEPDVSADIRILHEDEALLVVAKPAPLPMHPCGRFHRNTLQWLLNEAFHPEKPRPAHRLDADTTGVVVFTRTAHFAKLLAPQFRTGQVQKTYLLRCQGHPAQDDFTCSAAIGEDDLRARHVDEQNGSEALTHFHVLKRHTDGTSLLEARPQTGRTNQIRIHADHCGHPIVGDTLHEPGTATTRALGDPPLCLHASSVVLRHPLTGEKMEFQAAAPEWV
jgi:RluA family pseudouridine synthase